MNAVAIAVLVSVAARMPDLGGEGRNPPRPSAAAPGRASAKKGDARQSTTSAEPADAKEAAERVVQFAKDAGKRLDGKDPGTETRQLQAEVLKNLDTIIRQASTPPPPQQNQANQSPPMGPPSGNDASASQAVSRAGSATGRGSRNRGSRPESKDSTAGSAAAHTGSRAMPGPEPAGRSPGMAGGHPRASQEQRAAAAAGESERRKPPGRTDRMTDLYKDVWGHLPERLRQEMDLYYREQFMPRYQDLLRQYYSSLAERQRGSERE